MGFGEIIVVLLIGILALKPEDYSPIIKSIYKIRQYIISLGSEIELQFQEIAEETKENTIQKIDKRQINFYLKKIFELDHVYDGDYSLEDVKAYYHAIISKRAVRNIKIKQQ